MILQDISINDLPSTDKVTEAAVVTMVRASELGMSQYKAFITDRLMKGTVKLCNPINRKKLQTGIKKFKKSPRPHCVKRVRIRSFSGPYSPAFGLKTDQKNSKYGRFSHKLFTRHKLFLKKIVKHLAPLSQRHSLSERLCNITLFQLHYLLQN